jgi:hypothetical protein
LRGIIHLAPQAGVRNSLQNPFAYTEANVTGTLVMLEAVRRLDKLTAVTSASSSSVYGANQKQPFSVEDRVDQPVALQAATKRSCELIAHTYSHLYGLPATGLRHRIYNLGNHRPEKLLDFIAVLERLRGRTAVKELLPLQAGDVPETSADIEASRRDLGFEPTDHARGRARPLRRMVQAVPRHELIGSLTHGTRICRHRSRLCRPAGGARLGEAVRTGHRVRHLAAAHRSIADAKDVTGEVDAAALRETRLRLTADAEALSEASFFVLTVPTPIDTERRPDLAPLENACAMIGPRLQPGAAVFESIVYPGLTREFCGALLAKAFGLRQGIDFKLAYSPERINPRYKSHRLETITKIVAGEDDATLERVAAV